MGGNNKKQIKTRIITYGLIRALPSNNLENYEQEQMWRAVIDLALCDLIEPLNIGDYVEAFEWFNKEDEDFNEVCFNAGVSPDYVLTIKDKLLRYVEKTDG